MFNCSLCMSCYSHPSIYRASRGKRKMHGISRGTVYRGTHFLGPNFNQNRLIFIFLMPTVNRVVLGLCKRYVCNLINFPIPCLNLSGIIRLLTFSVLLRSTICLLPGPWQQAGGLSLLCTLVRVSSRHYSHVTAPTSRGRSCCTRQHIVSITCCMMAHQQLVRLATVYTYI